jgi:acyl-CoA thioesterase
MDSGEIAQRCAASMFARDKASQALGIVVETSGAGNASARMEVSDSMINGLGVCHGGYIFLLADSAFAFACNAYDRVTFAASATIEFVVSARLGDLLVAEARERYRGKRAGIYDVSVHNQDGQLVALFRGRSKTTEARVISDDSDGPGHL